MTSLFQKCHRPGFAGLVLVFLLAANLSAAPTNTLVVQTWSLNQFNEKYDGQWLGATVASDGHVYFGASAHSAGQGAGFFRFNPATRILTLLTGDLSLVCGENPALVTPQGKLHSEIKEDNGRLYFATHLAREDAGSLANYRGGHVLSFDLASQTFADLGIPKVRHTIYAGVALDAARRKLYVFSTPLLPPLFGTVPDPNDGPNLWRYDLATGMKEDLGRLGTGGDACFWMYVDPLGDCWFTTLFNVRLYRARPGTNFVESWPLPVDKAWKWVAPHPDGRRAVVFRGSIYGGSNVFSIFTPERFDPALPLAGAYTDLVTVPGAYVPVMGRNRIYYTADSNPADGGDQLHSLDLQPGAPPGITVHGALQDQDGRRPFRLGGVATDGNGRLFFVGDWYKLPGESGSIRDGVERATNHRFGELPVGDGPAPHVRITADLPAGSAILTWPAVPGRRYRVEFKDDLSSATWNALPDDVPATGSMAGKTNALGPGPQRIYRVTLLP